MNPCKTVVIEVWPIVSRAFNKYQNDIRIMERCCRAVRFMLRSVSQQVRELVDAVATQIMQLYTVHKHSCYLYLGSILVDEYATEAACISGLLDMLQVRNCLYFIYREINYFFHFVIILRKMLESVKLLFFEDYNICLLNNY